MQLVFFPIGMMEQMFVIFMTATQQSAIVQGYANTEITRDAFKKVILSDVGNLEVNVNLKFI